MGAGLFGGKVLKPESLAKMTTPFKSDYGFGLSIRTVDGHKLITHDGGIEGFNTSLNYYPDDKLTVIVLGNLNGGAPDQIASYLGKVALGQPVTLTSERKEVSVSASHPRRLRRHLPHSRLPTPTTSSPSKTAASPPSSASKTAVDLFAESETQFFLKIADAQIEFFRDPATHAVNRLIIYQNGASTMAKSNKPQQNRRVPHPS